MQKDADMTHGVRTLEASDSQPPDPERLEVRYELWDELPEGYRESAARIASFQALAEIVGVLPFAEWLDKVPDFTRKQMLTAKVQDEVGHGHVMARVAEDLGTPREEIIEGFISGRTKLLNIFHYGFETWEEIGPGALLMNSAAIVQFQALDQGTYIPYARALRKIEREEGFHYHHAIDLTHETMTYGNQKQRQLAQNAVETWLPRLLAYFGPSDKDKFKDNIMYRFGLKVESNDVLRQRWLSKIVPVVQELGLHVPRELAFYDKESLSWEYASPDWDSVKRTITDGGPRYEDWRSKVADSYQRNSTFRNLFKKGIS